MNAGEKMQQKKKKRREQLLRLWLPVAVVVVLVAVLSVSGVAMSVKQSNDVAKTGPELPPENTQAEADPEPAETKDDEEGESEEAVLPEEPESAGEEEETGEAVPGEDSFTAFVKELEDKAAADEKFMENESLKGLSDRLHSYDYNSLEAVDKQFYDDLDDYLTVELEAAGYANISVPAGTPYCGVEGGNGYYAYLLRRNSGTGKDVDTLRGLIADELNNNFAAMISLNQADPSVASQAGANTKEEPNDNYRFTSVTQNSDPVKKAIAPTGAVSGWKELGIIRAYQTSELADGLKQYLIANTRMSYAMYALCDLYVNYYGQSREDIIALCNSYTFASGDAWGSAAYDSVLQNPSLYASACVSFLEYVSVESVLQNNGGDETALLSFLFDQGPASFRVYNKWLGVE